jgi:hypothetical protein
MRDGPSKPNSQKAVEEARIARGLFDCEEDGGDVNASQHQFDDFLFDNIIDRHSIVSLSLSEHSLD